MDDPRSDAESPLTPRDRGWWSAFGDALLSGEFEDSVDPEAAAFVEEWRHRLAAAAGAAVSAVPSRRLEEIAARLAVIESRLDRIERRGSGGPTPSLETEG